MKGLIRKEWYSLWSQYRIHMLAMLGLGVLLPIIKNTDFFPDESFWIYCVQLLKDALEPYRGLPPETYIIGLGTQPVTAPWYHRHWAEFWRKHEQAHPITRTYTRVRNGKQYTYHQTDWATG